jgi:Rrf2 family protein
MQVSAKVDYGTRAMLVLARVYLENPQQLTKGEALASAQEIPLKFLEGILTELRTGGLVVSQRGARGGYRLARAPREISVADVLRTLDGPLAGVRGQRPQEVHYPGEAEHLRDLWVAVRAALRSVLDEVTLEDVVTGAMPEPVRALLADPRAWTNPPGK